MTRAVNWTQKTLLQEQTARQNFKQARRWSALTIEQAAARISALTGVSRSTMVGVIKRYEGGVGGITVAQITAAADVFNVSADFLTGRTVTPDCSDDAAIFGGLHRSILANFAQLSSQFAQDVFLQAKSVQRIDYVGLRDFLQSVSERIDGVRKKNKKLFDDDLIGGNQLLRLANDAEEWRRGIDCTINKQADLVSYHQRVISDEVAHVGEQIRLFAGTTDEVR